MSLPIPIRPTSTCSRPIRTCRSWSRKGLNVGYLAYNTTQAPFDNPQVRKALNMAINKQAIIDAVFQGQGKIAKNPIPPTMWSYDDSIQDDPYDPEGAKEMLAEGGGQRSVDEDLGDAGGTSLQSERPAHGRADPGRFRRGGAFRPRSSPTSGREYLKKSRASSTVMARSCWGGPATTAIPDNFLAVLLSCAAVENSNRAQWCHEPYDEIVQKAKQVSNQDERTALYKEAQAIFKDQAPWATIAHSIVFMPMSTKVTGYTMDPLGSHRFDGGRPRRVETTRAGGDTASPPASSPFAAVAGFLNNERSTPRPATFRDAADRSRRSGVGSGRQLQASARP